MSGESDALMDLAAENARLRADLTEVLAFLQRTATTGGSIVSSAAMTARQIAIARAADRVFVTPDGYGFVYVPGPRFGGGWRVESDCDRSRATCTKTDPAIEGDDETDILDEMRRQRDEWRDKAEQMQAFLRRLDDGGTIVPYSAISGPAYAIAKEAGRVFDTPDGRRLIYVPGPATEVP